MGVCVATNGRASDARAIWVRMGGMIAQYYGVVWYGMDYREDKREMGEIHEAPVFSVMKADVRSSDYYVLSLFHRQLKVFASFYTFLDTPGIFSVFWGKSQQLKPGRYSQ